MTVERCVGWRVGADVREQVVDHLSQPVVVAEDGARRQVGLERAVGLERLRGLDRLGDDVLERDRLERERPALVEVGEEQQVVDEHAHPLGLAADPLHRALEVVGPAGGAAGEELGVGADGGERRAELVRGVGDEPAELALGGLERADRLLDVGEHAVQREAEPADLGAVVLLDALREVAGGDRGGGLPHRVEGLQADPDHPEADARSSASSAIAVTSSSIRSRRWSVLSTLFSGAAISRIRFGALGSTEARTR